MAARLRTSESVERRPATKTTAGASDAQTSAKTFAAALTLAFFALGLFNAVHHEPWRDELQAWLIARDSPTLVALFHNLRYDGHPAVWYLLLYAATRFTAHPLAMQLLHLGIATASVYLFARLAPFTRLERALFCFGYFLAYEYAVVSRNYAAGVLCVFAFCALYRAGLRKNYLALFITLALLANTSAYGFLLAWAFALLLVYERVRARGDETEARAKVFGMIVAALIFLAASAISAWQMLPPADSGNVLGLRFKLTLDSLHETLSIVLRAFMPLPKPSYYLWHRGAQGSGWITTLVAVAMLVTTALALARRRTALLVYALGMGAILLFTHVKYYGTTRHHGHIYILFVACLWIAARLPDGDAPQSRFIKKLTSALRAPARHAFKLLLFAHVAIAVVFWWADWRYPFSLSKRAAEYVRERGLERHYVVAHMDAPVSALSAYLRRSFYYLRTDREGTFIVWDKIWGARTERDIVEVARRKAAERQEEVLIITHYRLKENVFIEPLIEITGSIVGDEDYYFYLVKP